MGASKEDMHADTHNTLHWWWSSVCSVSESSNSLQPQWTVAHQTPLSIEFSRQEYWNGLPFPNPGDLPHPGIKPESPMSPALAGGFFTTEPPGKPTEALCPSQSCTHLERTSYHNFRASWANDATWFLSSWNQSWSKDNFQFNFNGLIF